MPYMWKCVIGGIVVANNYTYLLTYNLHIYQKPSHLSIYLPTYNLPTNYLCD
jgi:hypothetical protein